jgi:hypothetical protein
MEIKEKQARVNKKKKYSDIKRLRRKKGTTYHKDKEIKNS